MILLSMALVFALNAQGKQDEILRVGAFDAGSVRIRVDARQRLVLDHFDGDRRVRQDIVALAHLDPDAIDRSEEENVIVLVCRDGRGQCISREVFKLATIRRTSRSTIPVPDNDPEGRRTIAALRSLARSSQDPLVDVLPATP